MLRYQTLYGSVPNVLDNELYRCSLTKVSAPVLEIAVSQLKKGLKILLSSTAPCMFYSLSPEHHSMY